MKRKSLVLLFCLILGLTSYAQHRVSGVVYDTTNEPVPGLAVLEKGTSNGVITDIDGRFTINVEGEASELVFSFVGMETQEITVGSQTQIDVIMRDSFADLDEVVVIGYGVQRRALITGANVNVGGDRIAEQNTATAMEALQGVAPGVSIVRNHGAPGAGTKVTIRGMGTIGNASPLYIVDGIAMSNIDYLNPSDIESIDVLKDAASAAIYGSRAANGVILVTTKKGKPGASTRVTYDAYFGVQNLYKKPSVLNAQEYMYIFDEARINDGADPYNWENRIINGNTYFDQNYPGNPGQAYGQYVWNRLQNGWTGTDWVDEITKSNAPVQSHSVNITGSSEDITYAMGFSYLEQTGIIGGDITDAGYRRLTARFNSEMVLFKNDQRDIITVGENFTFTNSRNRSVATGDIYWNDLHNAIVTNPMMPAHYDMGALNRLTYGYGPTLEGIDRNQHNPIGTMYDRHNYNWGKGNTYSGAVYAVIEPVADLKYRSSFGLNGWFGHFRSYKSVYERANLDRRSRDNVTQSMNQGTVYTWTNTLTYDTRVENHRFNFLVGSEMVRNVLNTSMEAMKAGTDFGLPQHAYLRNVQSVESVGDISATGADWAAQRGGLMSYMGRVSYNYMERYLFDATIRADGSSNFAKGNQWGYFPSVSGGWIFTDEDFMDNLDWMTFGKVRASWGQNGNQSIPNFIYSSNISYLERGYYFGPDKLVSANTAIPENIPNPDVTWETSEQLNIGLDANFLHNRLGLNLDWYKKTTKDWLVRAPILGTFGASAPYINGGDVENKGFEIMLSWNDRVGEFRYGVTLSGAQNRNKVTRLANAEGLITGETNVLSQGTSYVYRVEVGQPIGYFYGYKTDGIFQNQAEVDQYVTADGTTIVIGSEPDTPRRPGDVRFVDQNGDGVIDEADKVKLGSPHPDFELGMQLNAEFRGFYVNTTLAGKFGMQVMQSYRDFAGSPMQNYPTSVFNRWHGEGTSNRYPRLSALPNANGNYISDIYMYDADYLRINNLTFGYRFDRYLNAVDWVQGASLYVSVNNLYTFTKYDGMDPEVGYAPDDWASGIDLGLYPLPRTVMLGINVTF
ncbi:SusC/RagA family TonB-linked outer membrane protein [Natronoflexus pectinivorans]|uniref:TonB-linked SusC/RagA family outer membrane protein n=1 Tax=Natronoflexus pectinivorans TaxID=682526 RepID=A0A4R2GH30_9BACT|nr:TonB-dependent receptor [Natronoflexus pectinivorans]TCO07454.1 TonB-linked SusC/RagA family outer membrane protein [Natronoflexus pectinivorans]